MGQISIDGRKTKASPEEALVTELSPCPLQCDTPMNAFHIPHGSDGVQVSLSKPIPLAVLDLKKHVNQPTLRERPEDPEAWALMLVLGQHLVPKPSVDDQSP